MTQLIRLILKPFDYFSFIKTPGFEKISYYFTKRVMDILICLPLLAIFLFVLPLLTLIVKYKSPGKLFYTQKRTGFDGKEFPIFKLRTMHQILCDDGSKQALHDDERITINGKVLRHFHIDEFPQFFNVLIGTMTLVGPRPHSVPMDQYYSQYIPFYHERFKVRPGITGLAQIKGSNGQTPLIQDMESRILLDLEYIRTQSFLTDMSLLFKTILMLFRK